MTTRRTLPPLRCPRAPPPLGAPAIGSHPSAREGAAGGRVHRRAGRDRFVGAEAGVSDSRLILHHADFAVTLAAARDMGGVDLVLMSPPYCDARTYGAGVNWKLADYQRLGD